MISKQKYLLKKNNNKYIIKINNKNKYHIKKMMSIPDKNETIYQVIYNAITQMSNMKVLKEFGFFNYFISPGENNDGK
jgi:hypothetical protein